MQALTYNFFSVYRDALQWRENALNEQKHFQLSGDIYRVTNQYQRYLFMNYVFLE